MKPEEVTDEVLADTLATLATRARAMDLDLISSCRRLSALMSDYREELLSRMDGGDNAENAEILQALMENAARAHDDNPEESWARHLACKQRILTKIQEKSLAAIA